ncbi:hypothetical protein AVEN_17097-1 [Araneus ventricosus]|uniref:Uncharacterized protein n=1 Tax=Araneus ventricosus TaxID=182803 RepID=A0A4Y2TXT9_ARAVE|nr:hypothetical protein AVEN_17097-1 [Araneus ventricosus]
MDVDDVPQDPGSVPAPVLPAANDDDDDDDDDLTWGLVVWGLMAQQPFLAKLRQSNVKIQHSGTKILKFSENVKKKLFEMIRMQKSKKTG